MGGILFYVPEQVSPWVSIFDNTKWVPDGIEGLWDGVKWLSQAQNPPTVDQHVLDLRPINGWEVGFRPTMFRITTSLNGLVCAIQGSLVAPPIAGTGSNSYVYDSLDEYPFTFAGVDIGRLFLKSENPAGDAFSVLNIEFLVI